MNLLNLLFRECSTRYGFVKPWYLVSILSVLCALCGSSLAQDFKQVHPGVEYAQVEHKLGDDPVKINLLRLDLTKVRLDVHHALDKAIGLETTSSIATRKGAVAAINAGFFRLDKSEFAGEAAGILVVNGEFYSESVNNRAALTILSSSDGTLLVEIGHLEAAPRIYSFVEGLPEINGINRERKSGEVILYSGSFGQSTRTKAKGVEIAIDQCKTKDEMGTPTTRCNRFKVNEDVADSIIPKNGYVLSLDTSSGTSFDEHVGSIKKLSDKPSKQRKLAVGTWFRPFNSTSLDPGKSRLLDLSVFAYRKSGLSVTNGVPQLIKNGKIDITWEQEKASRTFVETRHPRTAVAKLKDGKFLMMTVDGRQPGVSVGMTLQELAEYLFSLGAVDAMNLDGGGSTTMFLDGKVVNKPSDPTGERKIGDAIVVTLRNKPAARK